MPHTLAAPFRELSLSDARNVVFSVTVSLMRRVNAFPEMTLPELHLVDLPIIQPHLISRAFVDGDHWQGSTAWMGPRPDITSEAYAFTMQEIARQFVSQNAIGEVVDRHVGGVMGSMPAWGFAPLDAVEQGAEIPTELQALIDEAEALLTTWWDERRVHEMLQRWVVTMLLAERGPLRVFIPRGKLTTTETGVDTQGQPITKTSVEAADVKDALRLIYVEDPLPERATVALDGDTQERLGIVLYRPSSLLRILTPSATSERAELSFLDGPYDAPLTILRMIDGGSNAQELSFDFGGRLTIYEGTRTLFVTPQMWQNQKALNLALSMSPRTVVTSGFLERTILNAQMPGEWETNETTGEKTWKPGRYHVGAGATNSLVGIELMAADGTKTVTTPSVVYRDPVDTAPLTSAATAHYHAILAESKQLHVLAVENTQASGKTHEQARADFRTSLLHTKMVADAAGQWLIGLVITMAEVFGGQRGKYTSKLRPVFSCHLDVGPVTSLERTALDGSVTAGTLSRETAIALAGTVDTDAELAKLAAEPGHGLDVIERQAKVVLEMTQAGASIAGACEFAGIEEETITQLTDFSQDPPPPPAPAPLPGDPNAPPGKPTTPPTPPTPGGA